MKELQFQYYTAKNQKHCFCFLQPVIICLLVQYQLKRILHCLLVVFYIRNGLSDRGDDNFRRIMRLILSVCITRRLLKGSLNTNYEGRGTATSHWITQSIPKCDRQDFRKCKTSKGSWLKRRWFKTGQKVTINSRFKSPHADDRNNARMMKTKPVGFRLSPTLQFAPPSMRSARAINRRGKTRVRNLQYRPKKRGQ